MSEVRRASLRRKTVAAMRVGSRPKKARGMPHAGKRKEIAVVSAPEASEKRRAGSSTRTSSGDMRAESTARHPSPAAPAAEGLGGLGLSKSQSETASPRARAQLRAAMAVVDTAMPIRSAPVSNSEVPGAPVLARQTTIVYDATQDDDLLVDNVPFSSSADVTVPTTARETSLSRNNIARRTPRKPETSKSPQQRSQKQSRVSAREAQFSMLMRSPAGRALLADPHLSQLISKLRDQSKPLSCSEMSLIQSEIDGRVQGLLSKAQDLQEKVLRSCSGDFRNIAVSGGDESEVKLPEGVDADKPSSYNLAALVEDKHFAAVRLLLDKLPNPRAKVDEVGGSRNATALCYAIFHKNMGLVQHLIQRRANATVADKLGNTPLHYCVSYDFVEPIEKLVKYSNGLTALEMENNQGHTPVELARDAAAKDPKWDLQRTGVADYATCSFVQTKTNHRSQVVYQSSAVSDAEFAFCDACAARCYAAKNMPVARVGVHSAFCDCGAKGVGHCSALSALPLEQLFKAKTSAASASQAPPMVQQSNVEANFFLFKAMEELLQSRKDSQAAPEPKAKKQASSAPGLFFWVKLILLVLVTVAGTAFLTLVVIDTRAVAEQHAFAAASAEKDAAGPVFAKMCVRDNMDAGRKLATYFLSVTENGEVIGDAYCDDLRRKMAIDPAKVARADSKILARIFAESLNEFVHSISLKTWAIVLYLREGPEKLTGYASSLVDLVSGGGLSFVRSFIPGSSQNS